MEDQLSDLSRVECPVCEGDILAFSGQGGTAEERDTDEVEAGDGHEGGGDRLVAAAEGDGGVGEVTLVHDLNAVCDGVPGDEGVPHRLGAVGEAVTIKGNFPFCVRETIYRVRRKVVDYLLFTLNSKLARGSSHQQHFGKKRNFKI